MMNFFTRRPQPVLAAVLLGLLAGLWLLPGPSTAPPRIAAALSAAAPGATDSAIGQWGDTALARPLFSPARRPADQAGGTADGALPRLSAIILTGATGMAVFAADGQKPQLVGQGGVIGGYVLNRIAPDHIELSGPGGMLILHPQFSNAATAAASGTASDTTTSDRQAIPPQFAPFPGQTQPAFNPSSNPALMIEQNY
jgi:hypothetical protein